MANFVNIKIGSASLKKDNKEVFHYAVFIFYENIEVLKSLEVQSRVFRALSTIRHVIFIEVLVTAVRRPVR